MYHFEKRFLLELVVRYSVGQGSLLFGMSGLTAHDARYASFKEERAHPIYRRVQHPRASTGARRSKVERLKVLVAGSIVSLV